MLKTINSHNGWDPLQEVWLGDVYPASWYDHLESSVRDVFQELTEITQQDLAVIQKKLESMGVTVQRPRYDSIDNYITNGQLVKPQICPRDNFLVLGNTLYVHKHSSIRHTWTHTYERYLEDSTIQVLTPEYRYINGANVVRVGQDVIVDIQSQKSQDWDVVTDMFKDYRLHKENNGGHMDGCFSILRPGLLLANNYFDGYERNFPGWEVITLDQPEFKLSFDPFSRLGHNGKFWNTGTSMTNAFNDHVIKHALDWVGNYTETYFELNCLVVDTKNVVMLSENLPLAEELSKRGITVHWVPFRARRFWDGAMHCVTVDIRRDSQAVDYFPERHTIHKDMI